MRGSKKGKPRLDMAGSIMGSGLGMDLGLSSTEPVGSPGALPPSLAIVVDRLGRASGSFSNIVDSSSSRSSL